MSNAITPSIYKIDLEKVREVTREAALVPLNVHALIQTQYEKRKELIESTAQSYHLVIPNTRIGQYTVAVYKTASDERSHPWAHLFSESIPGLEIKYPNLAAFFAKDDECYAISAGSGYTFFEQFIDTSFPLEVARHIMSPYLSATTERDITGAVYGRDQQFRTSQLVVSSQNLGTVWQAIKGEVIEDVKLRDDFRSIFKVNRGKIGVSAGSSLKIHKAIEINKLAELLGWIEVVLEEDIPPAQQKAFEFLDGLTELNSRKEGVKIEAIKLSLGEKLLEDLINDNPVDFDFSHKDFVNYQGATRYHFANKYQVQDWERPPTAPEVFEAIKAQGLIDISDGASLLKDLSQLSFFATNTELSINSVHGSILDHLHGEIEHANTRYFLVDGKFYAAKRSFIDRVHSDFSQLLLSRYFNDTEISLDEYDATRFTKEADYNDSYQRKADWLEADRVFTGYVEIADLFHWKEGKLYIIHNKHEFGVTVRDVCSQVLHSMHIINRMRDTSNEEEAGKYFDKIKAKHYSGATPPISREEFIRMLIKTDSANIIYIIGYVSAAPVTAGTQSNIAKFEAVKLCNTDRKQFEFGLKILHIPRV